MILGVVVASYDHTLQYPGWWALLPTIATALLISAGAEAWVNRRFLAHPVMVAIGLVAYPLYLWHWSLLTLVRLHGETRTLKLSAVVAAFVLAWLTYIAVEKPIRRARFHDRYWRYGVPVVLVAALLGVGALGAAIDRNEGYVTRFPEQVRYLANFRYEREKTTVGRHCFLRPEQGASAFGPLCIEPRGPGQRVDLVLLWGDSFAAHLYPGLQQLQLAQAFPLAQLTSSACPPVVDAQVFDRAGCRAINEYVISRVRELRPRNAILAANWPRYSDETPADGPRSSYGPASGVSNYVGLQFEVEEFLVPLAGREKSLLIPDGNIAIVSVLARHSSAAPRDFPESHTLGRPSTTDTKPPRPIRSRGLWLVAGAGFEPATFGL